MSCESERRKRQTYNNVKWLASKAISLVQDDIIIYEEKPNIYGFCCKTEYRETKGKIITILENNKRNAIE